MIGWYMHNKLDLRKIDCSSFFYQACKHLQGTALNYPNFSYIKSEICKSLSSSNFFNGIQISYAKIQHIKFVFTFEDYSIFR